MPLILAGCASEGPLRPPSLKLPGPVQGLTAERAGNSITLRWISPGLTTDGVALTGKHGAGALSAEICREEPPGRTGPCAPIARPAVASGEPATFSDALPTALTSGTLRPLQYRVRILNGRGKGGSYSIADTLAGAAPPPVSHVRVRAVVSGAELMWQRDPGSSGLHTLIRVERGPSSSTKPVLLQVDTTEDRGGALDGGARPGVAQHYIIVREAQIAVQGRSVAISSAPVSVTLSAAAAIAAPAPPTGLEAVPGSLSGSEVDLVWQASPDAFGYTLYRAEGDASPAPLATVSQSTLLYADTTVKAGLRYRYSVAATSAQGAAGERSAEVSATVPVP